MSCTSKPDERVPDEQVMHFPNAMAKNGQYLAVSSSSADGKYHFGRLLVLDIAAIKRILTSGEEREPIAFKDVVISNNLIPEETGEIYFSDSFIVLASRENNQVNAFPMSNGISKCHDPKKKIETCPYLSSMDLLAYDPFSLVNIKESSSEEVLLLSYLSSDRIDVMRLDKSKTKDALALSKSFNAMEWLRPKVDPAILKNQRLLTRKMAITNRNDPEAKVYFLLERHSQKVQTPTKPKASYIVSIKANDLLGNNAMSESQMELVDLADLAGIAGVQDFFIDDTKKEAYVLSRIPEALWKIDLSRKTLIEVVPICTGALSMAVDLASDLIVLPCFVDNRVTSFSMAPLTLKSTSKILGRGPSFAVITDGYVFCTLGTDGIVAILDDKQLSTLGRIFNKAPINRTGS